MAILDQKFGLDYSRTVCLVHSSYSCNLPLCSSERDKRTHALATVERVVKRNCSDYRLLSLVSQILCPRSVIFRVLKLEAEDYCTHPLT